MKTYVILYVVDVKQLHFSDKETSVIFFRHRLHYQRVELQGATQIGPEF